MYVTKLSDQGRHFNLTVSTYVDPKECSLIILVLSDILVIRSITENVKCKPIGLAVPYFKCLNNRYFTAQFNFRYSMLFSQGSNEVVGRCCMDF